MKKNVFKEKKARLFQEMLKNSKSEEKVVEKVVEKIVKPTSKAKKSSNGMV